MAAQITSALEKLSICHVNLVQAGLLPDHALFQHPRKCLSTVAVGQYNNNWRYLKETGVPRAVNNPLWPGRGQGAGFLGPFSKVVGAGSNCVPFVPFPLP